MMGIQTDAMVRQIKLGLFDYDIERITQSAIERRTALRQLRTTEFFEVDDIVEFNDLCGTPYLRGQRGKVVAKSRVKVAVQLEQPIGRFVDNSNGEIKPATIYVQPSVIDHVR